ncbi:MAG: MBL fold metallo-hydrolase [Pseudomonadota bacterium]
MLRYLAISLALLSAPHSASAVEVYSYASQVNDVDSVNSHWFETTEGVVLVDVQRLLPEAERMIEHLRATTSGNVTHIIITHAHTDHYGGLPVVMTAFPEAQIITDETTLRSIREDGRGFIAMRNERHGERFPPQEALTAAVADAHTIADGDVLEVGGERLAFSVLAASEAEATVMVDVLDTDVAFIGDLINIGAPAVPFESIVEWLHQLDVIEERFDACERLYQGHGPAPTNVAAIPDQRRFLRVMEHLTRSATEDAVLTKPEEGEIVFALEAKWPFLQGVAGATRRDVLGFAVRRVAQEFGATVQSSN